MITMRLFGVFYKRAVVGPDKVMVAVILNQEVIHIEKP